MRLLTLCGSTLILACLCPALTGADDAKEKPKIKVKVEVDAKPAEGASLPVYKLNNIVGMKVRDHAGKDIGKIEDLVVELHSGEVRYAALSFGGFLGLGDKLFAIPLSSLAFDHGEKSADAHFVLDMSPEKFKTAPGFDKDHWPDFANSNWSVEIDKFYIDIKANKSPPSEKQKGRVGEPHSATFRATKVTGMEVKNDAEENLGSVEDLVVDMRHSVVRYAALSFGGFLGLGDKLFAIPWNAFEVRTDVKGKNHLVLNVPRERLKNAPGFNKKNWPDVGDPRWSGEIDRHYQEELRRTTAAKERPAK